MNWNVHYYVNGDRGEHDTTRPFGFAMLAPYTGAPIPRGYRLEIANTMTEVRALERRLQQQDRDEWEHEANHEHATFGAMKEARRDQILANISQLSTPYTRDYFKALLDLRDSHPKKAYFESNLEAHLMVLHMDSHGRPEDREIVNLDRVYERIEKRS